MSLPAYARLQRVQAGFKNLLQDGNVLKCWSERLDAIYHAELGASAAILKAGFNLDCLLQRCAALCNCCSCPLLRVLMR